VGLPLNASSYNCGIQDSIIVSQQALEAWLSTHCIAAALPASETDTTTNNDTGSSHNSHSVDITISDILCEHNYLDPTKAHKMKRINLVCIPQLSTMRFVINLYPQACM
jgi:ubiquitin carboxyl-terminal hydrolase 48